jgi:DNA-binding IclR family transcriptional regulator
MTPASSQHEPTPSDCPRDPYLVKSVVRCCQVLRAVQGEGALPLHVIVRRTGLPKSLVFRLLCTLRHIGWVEKHDDGRTYRSLVNVPRLKRKNAIGPV